MTKGYGNNSPSSLITVTSQWPSWRLKSPALDCLCNRLSKLRSKETPKPALLPLCERNPPVTLTKGGFPSQRASNAENVSIWWRHNVVLLPRTGITDTIPYKLIEVSWHRCSMAGIAWLSSDRHLMRNVNFSQKGGKWGYQNKDLFQLWRDIIKWFHPQFKFYGKSIFISSIFR